VSQLYLAMVDHAVDMLVIVVLAVAIARGRP
jgi:hypothetical protein